MTPRMTAILAKAKAVEEGRKTYEGKPCSRHPNVRERWVSNGCCVQCTHEGRKPYIQRNKAKLAVKRREWSVANPQKTMLQRARRRAMECGLEFDLSPDSIEIPTHCPVLGIELFRGGKDNSPSLDRIDNSRGYVDGNVVVVSF